MSDPLDVARYILTNDEGELRSGWRVLAFCILLIIAEALLSSLIKAFAVLPLLDFLRAPSSDPTENLDAPRLALLFVAALRDLLAVVVATAICARVLERRSFASVGLKLHRGWGRDFALGSVVGAASLAIAVGIAAGAGAINFEVQTRGAAQFALSFVIVLTFFLISGAFEELLFRGFAFQALAHNLGGPAALAVTSAAFGIAHLSNESASIFSTANTVLAGVWLGLAYLLTRSLWMAIALHYSWNFAMVFVFGLPVSGFTTLDGLAWLRGNIGTPGWVSGGSYGPEGGVAATAALVLSTLVIWRSGLFRASDEMLAAIRHGKREQNREPSFVRVTPEDDESKDGDTHGDARP